MSLFPGDRLGPYEIVAPLAAGGMGEVYRARDARLARDVAIKVIATTPDVESLRRFEQEARATSALNHPNILTVYDIGTEGGHPFLVLELLEGRTLREVLVAGERPPLRQVLAWGAQIARGLAVAHARGIVHRDLKPENVFLTADASAQARPRRGGEARRGARPALPREGSRGASAECCGARRGARGAGRRDLGQGGAPTAPRRTARLGRRAAVRQRGPRSRDRLPLRRHRRGPARRAHRATEAPRPGAHHGGAL